ncbi:hypothetical protein [Paludisphaera mucosa]|uniref:Uncharacterized protein n=1 Tax=Paludisphaera mucosa TaxID=3030827 RepID=A0ABT6F499_9BACT|nr:hypothetical protein [Paludisphaera mucosa]MDG3002321.1 hypothetical protein [Paludisphaera mucosa]
MTTDHETSVLSEFVIGLVLILAVMGFPVAWLASEFRCGRKVRIALGIAATAVVAVAAWALGAAVSHFQYNADFGSATKALIEASIEQIEDGRLDRVLKAWRGLNAQYRPTYENRAQYPELAAEATSLIRGETPFVAGTRWDVGAFDRETWVGHWEDDTGFWIVVGSSLDVHRSGYPPEKMQAASLSGDFTRLTFREGERWRHTLTLVDKYELTHESFDLTRQEVWRTEPMFRLIRATEEQKRGTRRDAKPQP